MRKVRVTDFHDLSEACWKQLGATPLPVKQVGSGGTASGPSLRFTQRYRPVAYSLWELPDVDVTLFVLPAGSCLPLHDHPDMVVVSKLLYGTLNVESFDRTEAEVGVTLPDDAIAVRRVDHGPWTAEDKSDAGASVRVLLPNAGGNYHELHAVTNAAFLDVLAPPYEPYPGQRPCTYYTSQLSPRVHLRPLPGIPEHHTCSSLPYEELSYVQF